MGTCPRSTAGRTPLAALPLFKRAASAHSKPKTTTITPGLNTLAAGESQSHTLYITAAKPTSSSSFSFSPAFKSAGGVKGDEGSSNVILYPGIAIEYSGLGSGTNFASSCNGAFYLYWSPSCPPPNAMVTQVSCPLLDIPTELVWILSILTSSPPGFPAFPTWG